MASQMQATTLLADSWHHATSTAGFVPAAAMIVAEQLTPPSLPKQKRSPPARLSPRPPAGAQGKGRGTAIGVGRGTGTARRVK